MLPRDQVAVLWLDKPLTDNLRLAETSGHSRFPVCEGSLDQIKGMLLVREWLWQIQALGPDTPFKPLLRPALEFGLKTPIHVMIERFRNARSHLAIVLDDERRLAGIVTFEDVLEEIVGDIRDELDIGLGPIYERTAQTLIVSGALTVRELQAETGWSFEWQPRETVAAWIVRHKGTALKRDECYTVDDYSFTALEVQGDRLRRVRIERSAVATE
jgi:CBS domain containing-hemolysin-like protein